jgi:cytochrome c biogenesis protein CcmG/thiol:disulfide interchange protein DsbE
MIQIGAPKARDGTLASRRVFLAGLSAAFLAGCNQVVGTVLPDGPLPGLPGLTDAAGRPVPGFSADEFRRGPALLNIWASWCPECRAEHDQLMRLARDGGIRLLGLAFRDKPEAAAAYLRRAGNPFAAASSEDGRIARLLGQKGVPYSYVLSPQGRVVALVPGMLDDRAVGEIVMPALRLSSASGGASG